MAHLAVHRHAGTAALAPDSNQSNPASQDGSAYAQYLNNDSGVDKTAAQLADTQGKSSFQESSATGSSNSSWWSDKTKSTDGGKSPGAKAPASQTMRDLDSFHVEPQKGSKNAADLDMKKVLSLAKSGKGGQTRATNAVENDPRLINLMGGGLTGQQRLKGSLGYYLTPTGIANMHKDFAAHGQQGAKKGEKVTFEQYASSMLGSHVLMDKSLCDPGKVASKAKQNAQCDLDDNDE